MSARRQIGKARLYIEALDHTSSDGRWVYEVRIVVPRRVQHCGDQEFIYQAATHDTIVMSQPGGMIAYEECEPPTPGCKYAKLLALDSPEAFDEIARSAANLCSTFLPEDPDPDEETADAIAEAIQEAMGEDERLVVRRIR